MSGEDAFIVLNGSVPQSPGRNQCDHRKFQLSPVQRACVKATRSGFIPHKSRAKIHESKRDCNHSTVVDEEDAFGVWHAQLAADDVAREDVAVAIDFRADAPGFAVAAQAAAAGRARSPCLQRAQAFLQAFLERAPDGHRFAHAFKP